MSEKSQQPTGLRARKKALTRSTIEHTALQMFVDQGYGQVRLDDICARCDVSLRTFFRYFTSKEDLVLGRLRAHLGQADELFTRRPPDEQLRTSLNAVIKQAVQDYVAEPERELARLRIVAATPELDLSLSTVFTGFERLVRRVAASHMHASDSDPTPRLLAVAAVAAFRVALEMWTEQDARPDLYDLISHNLDVLAAGIHTDS
jgi:TetR/AcrR family transcriptional regulator, regulator of mycofactocin system